MFGVCFLSLSQFPPVTGGAKPYLADLAVFRVLRPIRFFTSGRDMVENTKNAERYKRVESAVGHSRGINA